MPQSSLNMNKQIKQLSLFPNLDDNLSENLYVIGNGFDIAHNYPTRYADFREWLVANGDKQFVALMCLLFPYAPEDDRNDNNYFWSDIENFMGEYRATEIMNFCVPNGLSYKDGQKYAYAVEDGAKSVFVPAVQRLYQMFHNWVNSIQIDNIPKFQLHPGCLYLTFNYTETLEKVYGIPDDKICHIHGKRLCDEEYVFGHLNEIPNDSIDADNDFETKSLSDIISEMNVHVKNINGLINANTQFFNKLSGVQRIIVIGHSLGKIDLPYFDKLLECVSAEAEWVFYYHSNEDLKNITNFINTRNIKKVVLRNS